MGGMGFWGRLTGADARKKFDAELEGIRERALRLDREAKDALQPGYTRTSAYGGERWIEKVTCETCGAVVMLRTQEMHSAWHESGRVA